MRKNRWLWVAALVGISGGCCGHPGVFQRIHHSMVTVQHFYDPLINQELVQGGIVQQAKQLELQTQEARKLAQEAGVVEAGASQDQLSLNPTE